MSFVKEARSTQNEVKHSRQSGDETILGFSHHNVATLLGIKPTFKHSPMSSIPPQNRDIMSSEEVIDSRLPYRVGYPTLPVMPVTTTRAQDVTMFGPIPGYRESDIRRVLVQYGIPLREVFFAYRVTCGMDTNTGRGYLVILSTYEDDCEPRWVMAVKDIRATLLNKGNDWSIELVDYDVYYQPLRTSSVPKTDHYLIEGWEEIRLEFLEMLQNNGHDCISIDVLYRDFPSREKQPTVIISARDADHNSWWDNTIPALKQLLQTKNLKIDIVLLYLKDLVFHTEPHSTVRGDFYSHPIQIGASCATSTSTCSGTLGGRIRLRTDSSALELGLTNYHVMAEGFTNQGSLSEPFRPDSRQTYGSAVSPSNNDHNAFVKGLKESLHEVEMRRERHAQNLGNLKENDPGWKTMKKAENVERLRHESLEASLDMAETTSRHIGDIYAASGFRTCKNKGMPIDRPESRKNWALDWCLIQMDRPISNQLPFMPPSVRVPDGAAVTQYCTMSRIPNYKVIKRGRTSGYTKGTVSAIDSTLILKDSEEDQKSRPQGQNRRPQGQKSRPQDIPKTVENVRPQDIPQTEEISPTNSRIRVNGKWGGNLVSVFPIISARKDVLHFMEPGDSGSLILQDRANPPVAPIIGLGFAGNDATLASYMMPIDLVLKDIEGVTGSKVIEPLYAGEAVAED